MKAPEPTPESLDKAREVFMSTGRAFTASDMKAVALALDEAVREERADRLALAEERNQLLGTEYKLRRALCPRCGPEKLEGIPRNCHMHEV